MGKPVGESGTSSDLPDGAGQLLDDLIGCWGRWDDPANESYYLTQLAPDVVQRGADALTHEPEKRIAQELQARLSSDLWNELPRLIAERRERQALEAKRAEERRAEVARKELIEAERDEERRVRKTRLIERIQGLLEADFFSVEDSLRSDPDSALLGEDELSALKTDFVRRWAAEELGQDLDVEQASAVAATGGDLQITARAGSGKTRTLVTRALFLQKHCGTPPESLLLLAFNRRAVTELEERFEEHLTPDEIPHVMTFHALAYALVHPGEELIFDDANSGRLGVSKEVQEVIDDLRESEEGLRLIRELMLSHFRDDWERLTKCPHDRDMEGYLAHQRSLTDTSLQGHSVRSFGEKAIANALFENDVAYSYEAVHDWDGTRYLPDFTLFEHKVVIEYFGITDDADYDEMSEDKREYWANRKDWYLIEVFRADILRNSKAGFRSWLLERLEALGVPTRSLSEEEIWKKVKQRSVDDFSKAMSSFIGRARNHFASATDFERALDEHQAASRSEEQFLLVGREVYRSYIERLEDQGKEDFSGLIHRAIEELGEGTTLLSRDRRREQIDLEKMRYVMVDEFQDFSPIFMEILCAIRRLSPRVEFSCVGDDWQAINSFAGSNLRFFEDFPAYFENVVSRSIQTNYRSNASVVKTGNALMEGRGAPGEPGREAGGEVVLADISLFRASVTEQTIHKSDSVTPGLLRLLKRSLDRGYSTVLLSRTNALAWPLRQHLANTAEGSDLERYLRHIRTFLPEGDRSLVSVATPHKFKGLEAQAIIVLDALERSYPLIHPNWVFLRLFGESPGRIEEEERRLFYVALTRAKESLTLVTAGGRESPFVADIERHRALRRVKWQDLAWVPPLDEGRLEIRVSGKETFNVKEILKRCGFQWNGKDKFWAKSVPEEGFSFDSLVSELWSNDSVQVSVLDGSGEVRYRS